MNLSNKFKVSSFFSILLFVLMMGSGQLCSAEGRPVIFSHKKTPITDDGVNIIGLFPIGRAEVDAVSGKSKVQTVTLGIENNSPYPFKLKSIYVDEIFIGAHESITNCPEELPSGGECECFFSGIMQPLDNFDSKTNVVVSYYAEDADNAKEKNLKLWEPLLSSQKVFNFSAAQQVTLKNIFPYDVEVQQIELRDGIYGEGEFTPEILEVVTCYSIKPDGRCEIVVPPQKKPTKYRTLSIRYKMDQQIQYCHIGLTNIDTVLENLGFTKQEPSNLGMMHYIYNNFRYYLVGAGVVIITGAVWYYKHQAPAAVPAEAVVGAAGILAELSMIKGQLELMQGERAGAQKLPQSSSPPPPPMPPPSLGVADISFVKSSLMRIESFLSSGAITSASTSQSSSVPGDGYKVLTSRTRSLSFGNGRPMMDMDQVGREMKNAADKRAKKPWVSPSKTKEEEKEKQK